MFVFPLIATIISLIFAVVVFRQYLLRRKSYQLLWAIGLFMFFLGSAAETIAIISAWTDFLAKVYYFFGAMVTVGFLAMGTIYLLASNKVALICLAIFFIISVSAAITVSNADIVTEKMQGQNWQWKEVMPTSARVIPLTINSLGSLILIGGAAYSALTFWRKKRYRERMIANILIAAGVLTIGAGHALGGLFGLGRQILFSIAMSLGISIMFFGFLWAGRPKEDFRG